MSSELQQKVENSFESAGNVTQHRNKTGNVRFRSHSQEQQPLESKLSETFPGPADDAVNDAEAGIGNPNAPQTSGSPRGAGSDEEPNAFDDSHLQADRQTKQKKKRKKKRPKSKRGLCAPTGFEEFSADTPIPPDEYEVERRLYDLGLPFTERIITAIRRYEQRRKMTPAHRDIFYKYLAYGGLDVGPNMFQGVSQHDAETMDKETLTDAMAQTSLSQDFRDIGKESSKWVVDFEGVMKGFLSRSARYFYPLDTEDEVLMVTDLLKNFMNYLVHHDVCPEHREAILAAKQVCTLATRELWSTRLVEKRLPGDFNIACSTLFDGAYGKRYDGKTSWVQSGAEFVGQTDHQARQIAKFAVACAGSEEQYQLWYEKAIKNEIKVTDVRTEIGLEITEVVFPDDETRDSYRQKTKEFRPVGKIYTKGWKNLAAPPDDLTIEEQALRKQTPHKDSLSLLPSQQVHEAVEGEYEFFIEEAILQHLSIGMKVEATVRTLNCGIHFIDEVFNVYLTFDTFLPNDRVYGYKEGRFLDGISLGDDGSIEYNPGVADQNGGNSSAADD